MKNKKCVFISASLVLFLNSILIGNIHATANHADAEFLRQEQEALEVNEEKTREMTEGLMQIPGTDSNDYTLEELQTTVVGSEKNDENHVDQSDISFLGTQETAVNLKNSSFDESPTGKDWFQTFCSNYVSNYSPANVKMRGKSYRCGVVNFTPNGFADLGYSHYLESAVFTMPDKVGRLKLIYSYRNLIGSSNGAFHVTIADHTAKVNYSFKLMTPDDGYDYNWQQIAYQLTFNGSTDFYFLSGHRVSLIFDTLGDGSENLALDIDNIALQSIIDTPEAQSSGSSKKLYRFWSSNFRGHFFTIGYSEAMKLATKDKNWRYEGVAYTVFDRQIAGTVPVYRFWSDKYRGHFYTTSETEKNNIINNDRNWRYEHIAFYVYPANYSGGGESGAGTRPVYRFWSKEFRHHFFTASESEMNKTKNDKNWKYEKIAWKVSK